jgi:hypothetical protein
MQKKKLNESVKGGVTKLNPRNLANGKTPVCIDKIF